MFNKISITKLVDPCKIRKQFGAQVHIESESDVEADLRLQWRIEIE